ncbi:M48 family metallopeptidase [Psychrobacter sp. M13]|uniref:M48 family metallopeptidase n=1 Tax=Psychrobacter sp. M13 TaxID=3067275 RepID=UPI00273A9A1B|nr:YgjP-like metallopeptidase domain-containing protein [Psychrobacter sp. M13]WLP94091.1 DUF45 domain-containing protein [Psychrobacter sp. M13]
MARESGKSLLNSITQRLAAADIELQIQQKRVKNINFRLRPNLLSVSVPLTINVEQIAQAIDKRVDWALTHHEQVLKHYERKQQLASISKIASQSIMLWGVAQTLTLNNQQMLDYYRQQLTLVMPDLFEKWQPIIKAQAVETRIKKMHTRWGSCNTRARRIWLSVYLPAYPIECTEYVIVHELCHLHHANHSRAFWQTVEKAMPDYKKWHDMLAGKTGRLD